MSKSNSPELEQNHKDRCHSGCPTSMGPLPQGRHTSCYGGPQVWTTSHNPPWLPSLCSCRSHRLRVWIPAAAWESCGQKKKLRIFNSQAGWSSPVATFPATVGCNLPVFLLCRDVICSPLQSRSAFDPEPGLKSNFEDLLSGATFKTVL